MRYQPSETLANLVRCYLYDELCSVEDNYLVKLSIARDDGCGDVVKAFLSEDPGP